MTFRTAGPKGNPEGTYDLAQKEGPVAVGDADDAAKLRRSDGPPLLSRSQPPCLTRCHLPAHQHQRRRNPTAHTRPSAQRSERDASVPSG
jgi:hypothetical protein